MSPIEDILNMLPEELSATVTITRVVTILKKLPQDRPVHVQVEQHGQDWYFCLSLKDLM